jgi:hypothetical protein
MGSEHFTKDDLRETLERNQKNEARIAAEKYIPLSIETLAKVMRGVKSSAGAKVSAAKAMLEHAVGKPTQQVNLTGPGVGGLTVNILHLSTGEKTKHVYDVPELQGEIADAISEAKQISDGLEPW